MKIMTANRLLDGAVVYLTANQEWSAHIGDAQLLADQAAENGAEMQAKRDVDRRLIVAPYTFAAEKKDEGIHALSMREKIRAAHEPTIIYDRGSWQGRI